jgi:Bacterial regulatory helix-turn-helix protein, lysR family
MELDLTQVRAFVEVAEQHHFGRAAARLFLTQQALSKRIQRLEHTVGEPLIHRGARGVQLSDAGRRFLPHARALLPPPRPPRLRHGRQPGRCGLTSGGRCRRRCGWFAGCWTGPPSCWLS